MMKFKTFINEDKGSWKHHLGINTTLAHIKQHAMTHKDVDLDGDVDIDDVKKTVEGEFSTDQNQTKKAFKKFKSELKHTRKGVAFE